jgi:hypothetical protein
MAKSDIEIYNAIEKQKIKLEYSKIVNSHQLPPDVLWEINDENFYKWVNKYYYLNLLEHFRSNLTSFEEWQKIWRLTDKKILKLGITSCIESKNDTKNIYKYIIEKESSTGKKTLVSEKNIDGKVKEISPNLIYKYKLIEGFVSYFDWFKFQEKVQNKKVSKNDLFSQYGISNYKSDSIQVYILNRFKMLKMGGLILAHKDVGYLNAKHIEFANLSRLTLKGNISTYGKKLSIVNSIIKDLFLIDCEIGLVDFYKCKIEGLKIDNSKINQWSFIDCNVTGEIFNTDVRNMNIQGGSFDVIFKDSMLNNVNAYHEKSNFDFLSSYKNLKQAFKNQGDDALEQEYYLKEKEYLRKLTIRKYFKKIKEDFNRQSEGKGRIQMLNRGVLSAIKNFKLFLSYISKTINFYYWGYGFKPINVLKSSLTLILSFTIIYFLQLSQFSISQMGFDSLFESINISVSSFSTLGFFSEQVKNVSETGVILESVIGGLSIGAFIASASNMKL